jgi:hypothetical protein
MLNEFFHRGGVWLLIGAQGSRSSGPSAAMIDGGVTPLDKRARTSPNISMTVPPHLPGLPTMAALLLAAMIAVWLGIAGPLDLAKLQNWQTLIAACVAAVGIAVTAYVAVRNVTKQIRIGILNREEDRIETELPGLREARDYCGKFLPLKAARAFYGIGQSFCDLGFGISGSTFQEDVSNALPNTDAATRHRVQTRLHSCWIYATTAESLMAKIAREREHG